MKSGWEAASLGAYLDPCPAFRRLSLCRASAAAADVLPVALTWAGLNCAGTYRMTGKTGSMRYMAPEVFLDNPQYDEKVDIYSTGLIMWYMTMGERPFDRVPAQVVAEKASSAALRPNLDAVHAVGGPRYASLMERCWSSEPNSRPSAGQLVDELESLTKEFKEKKDKGKCLVM